MNTVINISIKNTSFVHMFQTEQREVVIPKWIFILALKGKAVWSLSFNDPPLKLGYYKHLKLPSWGFFIFIAVRFFVQGHLLATITSFIPNQEN